MFCISRHGADFRDLMAKGLIDIMFANEAEILALMETEDFEAAVAAAAAQVPTLVVTRSERGAIAISNGERASCGAEPIEKVVDTTGAGDLFAAGFLSGQANGQSVEQSLKLGALCAAEIISHVGARLQVDLKALAAKL